MTLDIESITTREIHRSSPYCIDPIGVVKMIYVAGIITALAFACFESGRNVPIVAQTQPYWVTDLLAGGSIVTGIGALTGCYYAMREKMWRKANNDFAQCGEFFMVSVGIALYALYWLAQMTLSEDDGA